MTEFHAKRKIFYAAVESHGMERDSANYCITIGRRLRGIYASSRQVAQLEDEAVTALRGMLSRIPPKSHEQRGVEWQCVIGGLDEADTNILYIVPPRAMPVNVPLPELAPDPATEPAEPSEPMRTTGEVQRVLDAWGRPQKPEPEKPKPNEYRPVFGRDFARGSYASEASYAGRLQDYARQYQGSFEVTPQMLEQIAQMQAAFSANGSTLEQLIQASVSARRARPVPQERPDQTDFRAELRRRGKREGWSDAMLDSSQFDEFCSAVIDANEHKRTGNREGFARCEDRARRMYEALSAQHGQQVHWGPLLANRQESLIMHDEVSVEVLPPLAESQRSLDQLREKESKAKKRGKSRR